MVYSLGQRSTQLDGGVSGVLAGLLFVSRGLDPLLDLVVVTGLTHTDELNPERIKKEEFYR